MTVNFYKNTSDNNVVSKSLQSNGSTNVELLDDNNVIHPHFRLDGTSFRNYAVVNYAYIPEMMRFYYIDEWELDNGDMVTMRLSVDPLMSFRSNIKNITALIERQEHLYNDYVIDEHMPTAVQRKLNYIKIGSIYENSSTRYALTVAGGN